MNTDNLSTPADPQQEIAALKESYKLLKEENDKLRATFPQWVRTDQGLPEKSGKRSYEHVFCLIMLNGEVFIAAWNCEEQCWDDENADDYRCDATKPSHWMLLSSIENILP